MLTEAELTAMRSTQELALPDSGIIQRVARTPDGAGGQTEEWSDLATVACRLAASVGDELEVAGALQIDSPLTLTLPQGTDVTADDRFVFGSRLIQLKSVMVGSWNTALRIIATDDGGTP